MRMHLAVTDYGNFLQNEPSPLQTMTVCFLPVSNIIRFPAASPHSTSSPATRGAPQQLCCSAACEGYSPSNL
eukprot:831386-Rhodomonas_salina.1